MKKRIVLVLSAILCVVCLCSGLVYKHQVCYAAEDAKVTGTVSNQEKVKKVLDNWFYLWNEIDFELQRVQYDLSGSLEEDLEEQYKNWTALKAEVGEAKQITEYILSEDKDGNINASAIGKYANGFLKFSVKLDKDLNMLSELEVEKYVVQEEKASLAKAGVNTIMSITIVFVVLIFIAFVISLLKYVPRLVGLEKKEEKKEETVEIAEETTAEDVTDDTELVAVITAAIMASMGEEAPADGLVISSIKRRTGSKWKTR